MPKLAEGTASDAARKAVAADKEVADKSRAEFAERAQGRPTPTQEENDLAMYGAHILEHDDDGSGPDPNNSAVQNRHLEADKPKAQGYKTKSHSLGGE
jgi:hypothetical protein